MTPRALEIRDLLQQGLTVSEVARHLKVSTPAISHHLARHPELRKLRTRHTKTERQHLHALKTELEQIAQEIRRVDRDVRRSIQALNDELSALAVDEALGLRG